MIFRQPDIGLITSLLFATHPIHSEVIAVISHRKDLLALLFYLIAFILYLRGLYSSSIKKYILMFSSVVSYILAMFSKEVAAVGLPVMILVYHLCFQPAGEHITKFIKRYWAVGMAFIILIALFMIKLNVFHRAFNPDNILMVTSDTTTRYLPVLYTMLKSLLTYIRLLIFPYNLFINYEIPISMSFFEPNVILGTILLISTIIFWLKMYNKLPGICFAIAWFIVGWLPTSNILPLVQYFVAERFMYIPSVSFCVLVALGIKRLYQRYKILSITILFILIIIYIPITIERNADWNNMYSLRTDWCNKILQQNPDSIDARFRLGVIYSTKGQHHKAISEFKRIIELAPEFVEAYNCLAIEYQHIKEYSKALDIYKKLLEIAPYPAKIHNNMGIIYEKQGYYDSALAEYKMAIILDAKFVKPYYNIGLIYEKKKQYNSAITHYKQAIHINNTYSKAYEALARIYTILNDIDNAILYAKKAVKLTPSALNHCNLACLYYKKGLYKKAEKEIKIAMGLDPSCKTYIKVLKKIKQARNKHL
jgi:tetratricopeptide (TPR) repeat protein